MNGITDAITVNDRKGGGGFDEFASDVFYHMIVRYVFFFRKIRNYLHHIRLCVELFVYFCADKIENGN